MRIPLNVYDFAGGPRAMATILIRAEKPHLFIPVEAVVDTGSPATILGTSDLRKARISIITLKNLESRKTPVHYGGGKIETKILRDARLTFGNYYDCIMPVQIPVKSDEESTQPTILGVDFMIINNFRFFFYPNKEIAYFEKDDIQTE